VTGGGTAAPHARRLALVVATCAAKAGNGVGGAKRLGDAHKRSVGLGPSSKLGLLVFLPGEGWMEPSTDSSNSRLARQPSSSGGEAAD